MAGKRWLGLVGLATLLANAGCVTCCHEASKVGYDAGPGCAVPLCDRQKVYAVLVNGLTPGGSAGLDALRDRLAERGFTKVYVAQVVHAGWLEREMARVCADEPGARFVVVGYDLGCVAAKDIAERMAAAGVPVDALVYLDPAGVKTGAVVSRTVAVRSGGATAPVPHTETVYVPSAGHFDLPGCHASVEAVYRQMADAAFRVVHPPVLGPAVTLYEHAPVVPFYPAEAGPETLGSPAGGLAPVDTPTRVGPYGVPWPGQREGRPLPMPRKAEGL
ncbi:MAG: hypothetical protein K2X82_13490 [Gemmataceae bacterium]|nr:hypothetical protein [Gemmataceae bacterium]